MKEIEVGDTIEMFESPNYWNSWEELFGHELDCPFSLEYPHKLVIVGIDNTFGPSGRFAAISPLHPGRTFGFDFDTSLWTEDRNGKRDYNYKFIESVFTQTIKKELDL